MKRQARKDKSIFGELMEGLHESLGNVRGELTLRTTTLPAPPPAARPAHVVGLRKRLGMSQAVFAAFLNVSKKTVQSWEQGARVPRAGDLRLLQIVASEPREFERLVCGTRTAPGRRRAKSQRAA